MADKCAFCERKAGRLNWLYPRAYTRDRLALCLECFAAWIGRWGIGDRHSPPAFGLFARSALVALLALLGTAVYGGVAWGLTRAGLGGALTLALLSVLFVGWRLTFTTWLTRDADVGPVARGFLLLLLNLDWVAVVVWAGMGIARSEEGTLPVMGTGLRVGFGFLELAVHAAVLTMVTEQRIRQPLRLLWAGPSIVVAAVARFAWHLLVALWEGIELVLTSVLDKRVLQPRLDTPASAGDATRT